MASSRLSRSQSHGPERAAMLQRYWALHFQQNNLRRRISNASSDRSPDTSPKTTPRHSIDMSSSEASSVETSPTLQARNSSPTASPVFTLPRPAYRTQSRKSSCRSPPSIQPIPEHDIVHSSGALPSPAISLEEQQLYQVNHDIKSTLTDLLNCDAIRQDHKMRLWVQTRLMEAEMELRRQRKRRISAPTIVVSPAEEHDRRISL